jgi:hypothetical protein
MGLMEHPTERTFLAELTSAGARKLLITLLAIELGLSAVHIVLQVYVSTSSRWVELRYLFDLDQEVSLPTWFSSTQLAAVALLLFVQATKDRELRRPIIFVAAAFLYLSIDEGAAIHDRLYALAQEHQIFGSAPYLIWISAYAVVAAVSLVFLREPLSRVCRRAPWETLVAAAGFTLFVFGGVVLEIASHYVLAVTPKYLPFVLTVTAEEFCEMAGISFVLYAFVLLSVRAPVHSPVAYSRPVERSIDWVKAFGAMISPPERRSGVNEGATTRSPGSA